ncbi:MAG: hypothetical protein MJZ23_09930 [Paludibacteraceae bacterium]|nr:hypothetical protein [Paludibacteraceae bacterium]
MRFDKTDLIAIGIIIVGAIIWPTFKNNNNQENSENLTDVDTAIAIAACEEEPILESAIEETTEEEVTTEETEEKETEGEKSPTIGGKEYVDLGLPSETKWATCNVGASKPYECGYYFAWGETRQKKDYQWDTYKYISNDTITKYSTDRKHKNKDNKWFLEKIDDAANYNWGGSWWTPTINDYEELFENCDWYWVYNYQNSQMSGLLGKSQKNKKKIFFPAAGCKFRTEPPNLDIVGHYWTSNKGKEDQDAKCIELTYTEGMNTLVTNERYYGYTIRAVWK